MIINRHGQREFLLLPCFHSYDLFFKSWHKSFLTYDQWVIFTLTTFDQCTLISNLKINFYSISHLSNPCTLFVFRSRILDFFESLSYLFICYLNRLGSYLKPLVFTK